eukprot:s28_g43.t1
MKRPAARNQGRLVKRCALCGSTAHRIERCDLHGAQKFRETLKKLRKLEAGRPKNKTLRTEHKTRKSPKTTKKKYVTKAMKRYTGTTERKRSPADHRICLSETRLTSDVEAEKVAADWLIAEGWIPSPSECSSCGGKKLSELLVADDRLPHWRCLTVGCGDRMGVLSASIFNGLRCPLVGIQKMLHVYSRLSLTVRPSVADMVQQSNLGRKTCAHFVEVLRELESAEGLRLCRKAKLQGRVEVDGTFVSSYPVSKDSPHHRQEIMDLEDKRRRKGLEACKAYKAHIMCLGAQTRGHFPILHVCPPVITPIAEMLAY